MAGGIFSIIAIKGSQASCQRALETVKKVGKALRGKEEKRYFYPSCERVDVRNCIYESEKVVFWRLLK